jgi:hypothetical protein
LVERWEAFGTFTFRLNFSVETASRTFEDFVVREIPWVKCFYAVELHKVHGAHLHALFAGLGEVTTRPGARGRTLVTSMQGVNVWDAWHYQQGRNSVELGCDTTAMCRYCAKYITKECAWWNHNLSGEFKKWDRGPAGLRVSSVTPWAAARERRSILFLVQGVFPGAVIESGE